MNGMNDFMGGTTLLWFRQDLRLTDNQALLAAVGHGGPVIPVFIWAPEEEGEWPPGAAVALVAPSIVDWAGRVAAPARLPPDRPPRPDPGDDPRAGP